MKNNKFLYKLLCYSLLSVGLIYGNTIYSQEIGNSNKIDRRMTLYLEGDSGTLVNNTKGYFEGNQLEMGMIYNQNFKKVPWLYGLVRLSFLGHIDFNNINLNHLNSDGGLYPKYQYNGYTSAALGFNYIEAGLRFSDYAYIGIRNNFKIKMELFYTFSLPDRQFLKIKNSIEVIPFYIGSLKDTADPNLKADGKKTSSTLKLFSIQMEYGVEFAAGWTYITGLDFRSDGSSLELGTQGLYWELDSPEAFTRNFHIRWNNTIRYENDKFFVWGQLRYIATDILHSTAITENIHGKVNHDIYLRFGLGYKFNFGNL